MFRNNPRPIPSKGALRVLYQLAYISSGTAVGVATLCAEERRRRTVIVQRIAENAKRLRQSPRHVHNSAAAVAADYDAAAEWGGETMVGRTEVLPSEVERVYGKKRGKRRREREVDDVGRMSLENGGELEERAILGHDDNGGVERDSRPSSRKDEGTDQRKKRATKRGVTEGLIYSQEGASLLAREHITKARKASTLPEMILPRAYRQEQDFPSEASFDAASLPAKSRKEELDAPTMIPRRSEQLEHPKRKSRKSAGVAQLDREVNSFLHLMRFQPSHPDLSQMCDGLLFNAYRISDLSNIRILLHWKLSRHLLSETDVKVFCRHPIGKTASRTDLRQLYNLMRDVSASSEFQAMSPETRITAALSFAAQAASFDGIAVQLKGSDAFLFDPIRDLLPDEIGRVERTLAALCKTLLVAGKPSCAADLIIGVAWAAQPSEPSDQKHTTKDRFIRIWGKIFVKALRQHDLQCCASLLVASVELSHHRLFVNLLETTINHSVEKDARIVLSSMLQKAIHENQSSNAQGIQHLSLWIRLLSPKQQSALADACTQQTFVPWKLFDSLHEFLAKDARSAMEASLIHDSLWKAWRATKNLELVLAEYENAKRFLKKFETTASYSDLDVSMIEIYNEAGQSERALEVLTEISRANAHSSRSLSAAARVLAQKGVWSRLDRLLHLLSQSGTDFVKQSVVKNLNGVIRLYSTKHAINETWEFVLSLIDRCAFRPNSATTAIMLENVVASRKLDLIPKWAQELKSRGLELEIPEDLAPTLLSTYYRNNRPAHSLVMMFSRALARLTPSFDGRSFKDLIRQAIAWDLSRVRPHVRLKAEENIKRMLGADSQLPSPITSREFSDLLAERRDWSFESLGVHDLLNSLSADVSLESFGQHLRKTSAAYEAVVNQAASTDGVFPAFSFLASDQASGKGDRNPTSSDTHAEQIGRASQYVPHDSPLTANKEAQRSDPNSAFKAHPTRGVVQSNHRTLLPQDTALSGDVDSWTPMNVRTSADRRRLEQEMTLALSLHRYDRVLSLYHRSLNPYELPASRMALTIAVEACLRESRGGRTKAEEIMGKARHAGMNVASAMGPLLLHQMWHLSPSNKKDVSRLRNAVVDYYRTVDRNGWDASHHVGVTAANILINNGRPHEAVDLLNAIYLSKWALERPLDIVAMTVYLKAYAAQRHAAGLDWVFNRIVRQDMRVDNKFLDTIKLAKAQFGATRGQQAQRQDVVSALTNWRLRLITLRDTQRLETKRLGWQLVAAINNLYNGDESVAPLKSKDVRRHYRLGLTFEARALRRRAARVKAVPVTRRRKRSIKAIANHGLRDGDSIDVSQLPPFKEIEYSPIPSDAGQWQGNASHAWDVIDESHFYPLEGIEDLPHSPLDAADVPRGEAHRSDIDLKFEERDVSQAEENLEAWNRV